MRQYSNKISLSKNGRGIWDLDTIKGCNSGLLENNNGCYNDCYAYKTAKRYKIDFSKSIERHFVDESHRINIVNKIEKINMPFIRIGCSGDPSENWQHTINIIESIRCEKQLSLFPKGKNKEIVIITRHWKTLTDNQLGVLSKYNVCINTSISALDRIELIDNALREYNRIKKYCKSILRVVTCDFNKNNIQGLIMSNIQDKLLRNDSVLDTVFRPSSKNPFILSGAINVKRQRFMKSKQLISKLNKKTYIGNCENCLEKCGLNM